METSDTARMLTPRTCNTKQLYTTLSKNTGSTRQRWREFVEKEAKDGHWCCVEKHWDMKYWSAMAMCLIIVFECWGQEVSSIALCGSNESVSELFLSLPRQYKVLLSSLCPTVRLGTGADNQNGKRWHLPWRGGEGLEGVSSATYLFWKMIFVKNHLESFPDCENVFCT